MNNANSISQFLKPIFQRLPGTWLLLLIPFAIITPIHLPLLFSIYFITLNFLFFANNVRSAYSTFNAYRQAIVTAVTPWDEKYCQKVGVSSISDPSHDMPFQHVNHVIILPNYSEDMDTLCETLDVLASHPMAISQYKVCLAMEESEKNSENKAQTLINLYRDSFLDITFTIHPKGRPGEIRGKSSNVAWAATQMAKNPTAKHDHEIITVMDADTCFAADYFSFITYTYCTASPSERKLMMFSPCTVFDRNAKDVPAFVRVTDMFWSIGVISNLYQSSPIKIPCSAYSVSMDLAIAVNFWDAGPEAIGEDMHMYLKCFFQTKGKVVIKSVFSPASQCNIEGKDPSYISGLTARYTQAKRHLWGSLDTGYALRSGIASLLSEDFDEKTKQNFSLRKLLSLYHRLLEAHVLMGHLFILVCTSTLMIPTTEALMNPNSFSLKVWTWLTPTMVHPVLFHAIALGCYIRLSCLIPNLIMIYYYHRYHKFVGFERWILQSPELVSKSLVANVNSPYFQKSYVSSRHAHLRVQELGKRASLYSTREGMKSLLDWLSIPFAGLLFFIFPQVHVQISQLFTDSLEYKVAGKPSLSKPVEMSQVVVDSEPEMETYKRLLVMKENKKKRNSIASQSSKDEGFFEDMSCEGDSIL